MITPHETNTNLEYLTIHGVRILKMKPAPKAQQLPVMAQSKEGPPFHGNNKKIEPERAAELRLEIVKLDRIIARRHRLLGCSLDKVSMTQNEFTKALELALFKTKRSELQSERAYVMEQANPKKEPKPKPKKRAMRKKPERFRGKLYPVQEAVDMLRDICDIKMTETVKRKDATHETS